jgi:hypothetical protein
MTILWTELKERWALLAGKAAAVGLERNLQNFAMKT